MPSLKLDLNNEAMFKKTIATREEPLMISFCRETDMHAGTENPAGVTLRNCFSDSLSWWDASASTNKKKSHKGSSVKWCYDKCCVWELGRDVSREQWLLWSSIKKEDSLSKVVKSKRLRAALCVTPRPATESTQELFKTHHNYDLTNYSTAFTARERLSDGSLFSYQSKWKTIV